MIWKKGSFPMQNLHRNIQNPLRLLKNWLQNSGVERKLLFLSTYFSQLISLNLFLSTYFSQLISLNLFLSTYFSQLISLNLFLSTYFSQLISLNLFLSTYFSQLVFPPSCLLFAPPIHLQSTSYRPHRGKTRDLR